MVKTFRGCFAKHEGVLGDFRFSRQNFDKFSQHFYAITPKRQRARKREAHHRFRREKPCGKVCRDLHCVLRIKSYRAKKCKIFLLENFLSTNLGCHSRSKNRK